MLTALLLAAALAVAAETAHSLHAHSGHAVGELMLTIAVVGEPTVDAGRAVTLSVSATPMPAAWLARTRVGWPSSGLFAWPFVNGSQWGAPANLTAALASGNPAAPFAAAEQQLLLPLPRAGAAAVCVAIIGDTAPLQPFAVGVPMAGLDTIAVSRTVTINVLPADGPFARRDDGRAASGGRPLVGMEWEPWFTRSNDVWAAGTEAVPLIGTYNSTNADVVRQHALWLADGGVDFLVIDWTNNLWGCAHWADRGVYAQQLINATTFLLDTYRALRAEGGVAVPRVVLLLGLDNGPSEPMQALNEEAAWIADNYVAVYDSDQWVMVDGRPLLLVFDGGNIHPNEAPFVAPNMSVRWMSTQLQRQQKLASMVRACVRVCLCASERTRHRQHMRTRHTSKETSIETHRLVDRHGQRGKESCATMNADTRARSRELGPGLLVVDGWYAAAGSGSA
jgi:hypothetical protein